MNRLRKAAAALIVAGLSITGCSRKPEASAAAGGKLSGQNLLLITLDTTRADRIGCYGYKPAITPTLDALAARGTLFENAIAQVPLTLPSHCSIMTGRYPREHGVRDNARNALGTDFPTLATIAKEHGYKTAAFVATFVLDSRFGLERGFETYSDNMGEVDFKVQQLEWQQPANVVTDRALEWLESAKQAPFFGWVHYYDPHQPYEPPAEFRREGVHPYDGELAFVDTQVKRLTDWLNAAGLVERTLVVVVGDHGESFGEHVEKGHSNFVYQTNVHVPMFFAHPAAVERGKRIAAIVECVDVFPTILELFGWKGPADLMSRSLVPGLAGSHLESVSAYSESNFLLNALGWAEQRAIITDRWKYVSSVKPELFDLRSDPGEMKNLFADEPRIAAGLLKELRDRYDAMTPGQASVVELDSAQLKAIEGLGYAGGSTRTTDEFLTMGLLDPKDMQDVLVQFMAAKDFLQHDQSKDVNLILPLVQHIVERSPNSITFQAMLAMCYMRLNRPADAVPPLEKALQIDREQTSALAMMGDALTQLNRLDKAIEYYRAAISLDKKNAESHAGLADALHKSGKVDEAVEHYKTALKLFPEFAPVHGKLGTILVSQGKIAEAMPHFQEALRLRPQNPENHYNLGLCHAQAGRYSEAAACFQEAVRLKPEYGDAWLNLGIAHLSQGNVPAAKEAFTQTMSVPDFGAEARYHLGVVVAQQGDFEEAVKLFEQAIAMKPDYDEAILELSRFYLTRGQTPDAIRILQIGAKHLPKNVHILELLARVLATSRYDALRDGATALKLAEYASTLTGGREPVLQATLAAAFAETGNFERAVTVARQAQVFVNAGGAELASLKQVLQLQIANYVQQRPYRDSRF